jgi:hypothetical protein
MEPAIESGKQLYDHTITGVQAEFDVVVGRRQELLAVTR